VKASGYLKAARARPHSRASDGGMGRDVFRVIRRGISEVHKGSGSVRDCHRYRLAEPRGTDARNRNGTCVETGNHSVACREVINAKNRAVSANA